MSEKTSSKVCEVKVNSLPQAQRIRNPSPIQEWLSLILLPPQVILPLGQAHLHLQPSDVCLMGVARCTRHIACAPALK